MIGMKNQKNSLVISEGRSSLWWKGLVENVRFQPGLKEWWRSGQSEWVGWTRQDKQCIKRWIIKDWVQKLSLINI